MNVKRECAILFIPQAKAVFGREKDYKHKNLSQEIKFDFHAYESKFYFVI